MTKKPRALPLLAILALAGMAAYGIHGRRAHEVALAREAEDAAIPVVRVVRPRTAAAPSELALPGDVRAFYAAPIYARVNGYVSGWSHDIGARVRRGDALATIETPELDEQLAQARADLSLARANLDLARSTAARWHALLATNSVSAQSAEEKAADAKAKAAALEAQEARVRGLEVMAGFKVLRAPFDGVVTARNTDIGALVDRGAAAAKPLFEVSDVHEMRVYVRAPQAYAARLRAGMRATLTQPQTPGEVFPATLETTADAVSRDSRTLLVELLAANPGRRLLPGAYARVAFALPPDPDVLRVPASAVVFREQGSQLALLRGDGRVHLQDVRLGRNDGAEIEVRSGARADDRVIDSPPDTLAEGEAVRVAAP